MLTISLSGGNMAAPDEAKKSTVAVSPGPPHKRIKSPVRRETTITKPLNMKQYHIHSERNIETIKLYRVSQKKRSLVFIGS